MKFLNQIRDFHFEIYHFIILIIAIIISQVVLSYINVNSTEELINQSLEIYRLETAERLADFTTSSLELLIQQNFDLPSETSYSRESTVESIDFIITQQRLQKNVEDIGMVFNHNNNIIVISDGEELYNYLKFGEVPDDQFDTTMNEAAKWFNESKVNIYRNENISNYAENPHTFHVLVPLSLKGEVVGAVYMKISPDFSNISNVIESSFNRTGALISVLILLSLLTIFLITTYVIRERDQAQEQLYTQREKQLKESIETQKEASFAKRIYHAHHKAEKIIGFIKEDLRKLTAKNIQTAKFNVTKYANFIGRVLYDMKTYNPPVNVIRNPNFVTNLNSIITFTVDNIFKRIYRNDDQVCFNLLFDENVPAININEYVIWQIIEPLIQNAIDHNKNSNIAVEITTRYDSINKLTTLEIKDNGAGIPVDLLKANESGVKALFIENVSTKTTEIKSGYGCFIAFENCKRCGWIIDADNTGYGAVFTIKISHQ